MKNTFSSYLYQYDGSGSPVLKIKDQAIPPGKPYTLQTSSGRLFLAGGFSAITPQSAVLLSPTLQLNGDLTPSSPAALTRIAAAELSRHSSANWSSYTLNANHQVTVLAKAPDHLDRFIDTYGGILEIEPLLIEGCHAFYTTAGDLNIAAKNTEIQLDFIVRTPIDLDACTYCGNCGPVCPVDCLSETLFLDYDRCTQCGECTAICPEGAIDLHCAEKRSINTPALLLLEGVDAAIQDHHEKIFSVTDIASYFSTVFSSHIDEVISCNNATCQYAGNLDLGCNKCQQACRHGAVLADETGINIDHVRCVECGGCVGACPTGALQYQRFTDRQFIDYFRDIPLEETATVVIGNEQDLHAFWWHNKGQKYDQVFFLEYPNLVSLTPMHLFFLLERGAGRAFLLDDSGATLNPVCQKNIEVVNGICKGLFNQETFVERIDCPSLAKRLQTNQPATLLPPVSIQTLNNRRDKLASTLNHLINATGREFTLAEKSFEDFGKLLCDTTKCTLCLACLNSCRIESLRADPENYSLLHIASHCVQCGICVSICPEKALHLKPGLELFTDFFHPSRLAQTERICCAKCGKVFGTKKSHERVLSILEDKNMLDQDDNLFSLCDKCRVIELFEHNSSDGV